MIMIRGKISPNGPKPGDSQHLRSPGDLGIFGEWLFIFRELGALISICRDLESKLIVLGI